MALLPHVTSLSLLIVNPSLYPSLQLVPTIVRSYLSPNIVLVRQIKQQVLRIDRIPHHS